MKIRNWKLAILALIVFCLFISLGFWQLSRAKQKRVLLHSYAARSQHTPLVAKELNQTNDLRFYQTKLVGVFDNTHTYLLDNKIFDEKIGYEVYTTFYAAGLFAPILVDRGFVPLGESRAKLPTIKPINQLVSITGMLNLPQTYVAYGTMVESQPVTWPLRVEYINLQEISALENKRLSRGYFPYILSLKPNDPNAYPIAWQITVMGPERHVGYALQWFAFALTLLILFVALNRSPKNK